MTYLNVHLCYQNSDRKRLVWVQFVHDGPARIVRNYYFSGRSCSAHFATSPSHNNSVVTAIDFAQKCFVFGWNVNVYSYMKNQSTHMFNKIIMIIRFNTNINENSSCIISPASWLAIIITHFFSIKLLRARCTKLARRAYLARYSRLLLKLGYFYLMQYSICM